MEKKHKQSQNMEGKNGQRKKKNSEGVKNEIPEFTQEELQAAFDKLKNYRESK